LTDKEKECQRIEKDFEDYEEIVTKEKDKVE